MSERLPEMKPPARREPVPPASRPKSSWTQRIAGTAALLGTLGGIAHEYGSDDHRQRDLNAAVPDHDELRQRGERVSRTTTSSARGPSVTWDMMVQAGRASEPAATQEEVPPPVEVDPYQSAVDAGREVMFQMFQSGEYRQYFGHYQEFASELRQRVADHLGIANDPDDRRLLIAENVAGEELEAQSDLFLERSRMAREQGRSGDEDIASAIRTRALKFPSEGAELAVREHRGDLAVESIRQYPGEDHLDGLLTRWASIVPMHDPEGTSGALNEAWRYLSDDEREHVRQRIMMDAEASRVFIAQRQRSLELHASDPDHRSYTERRIMDEQRRLEDWSRLYHHWYN